jgi:hypothetical protein
MIRQAKALSIAQHSSPLRPFSAAKAQARNWCELSVLADDLPLHSARSKHRAIHENSESVEATLGIALFFGAKKIPSTIFVSSSIDFRI